MIFELIFINLKLDGRHPGCNCPAARASRTVCPIGTRFEIIKCLVDNQLTTSAHIWSWDDLNSSLCFNSENTVFAKTRELGTLVCLRPCFAGPFDQVPLPSWEFSGKNTGK